MKMTDEVVLQRLSEGWFLDPSGRDGLGGWLFKQGVKGYPVSVSVMNRLVLGGEVVWTEKWGMYCLPEVAAAHV
jgi:hypothetical protein